MNTKELSPRWKDISSLERSAAMSKIANAKHAKTSERQKKLHARKMVNARGTWQMIKGKKVYVRNK